MTWRTKPVRECQVSGLGWHGRPRPGLGDVLPPSESMEPPPVITAGQLLERIGAGDALAFAEFYDRYSGLLYGLALKVLGNAADAEEVFQEACVTIWERAPRYQPSEGQALGWATTIVRNRAIDRLRAGRRKAELVQSAAVEASLPEDSRMDGADGAVATETAGAVRAALERLAPDQRQAIELAFFRGLTQMEIASQLGQPLGTIKARIRRGMLVLRDQLEGHL